MSCNATALRQVKAAHCHVSRCTWLPIIVLAFSVLSGSACADLSRSRTLSCTFSRACCQFTSNWNGAYIKTLSSLMCMTLEAALFCNELLNSCSPWGFRGWIQIAPPGSVRVAILYYKSSINFGCAMHITSAAYIHMGMHTVVAVAGVALGGGMRSQCLTRHMHRSGTFSAEPHQ